MTVDTCCSWLQHYNRLKKTTRTSFYFEEGHEVSVRCLCTAHGVGLRDAEVTHTNAPWCEWHGRSLTGQTETCQCWEPTHSLAPRQWRREPFPPSITTTIVTGLMPPVPLAHWCCQRHWQACCWYSPPPLQGRAPLSNSVERSRLVVAPAVVSTPHRHPPPLPCYTCVSAPNDNKLLSPRFLSEKSARMKIARFIV